MASQLTILGKIVFENSKLPISDVTVELWDSNEKFGWLVSSISDKKGNFSCIINPPLSASVNSGSVILKYILKRNGIVFKDGLFSDFLTEQEIKVPEDAYDLLFPSIESGDAAVNFIKVSGIICDENGAPCQDKIVNVYENGFRKKTILASGVTSEKGQYSILINTKLFGNSVVLAGTSIKIDVCEGEDVLISSADIFELNNNVVVNLSVTGANLEPEYTRYLALITSITGNTPLELVTQGAITINNEVRYIAGVLGIGEEIVGAVVNAHKFSTDTGLPVDVLYALMRGSGFQNDNPVINIRGSKFLSIVENAIMTNVIQTYPGQQTEGNNLPTLQELLATAKNFQVAHSKATFIVGETYSVNDLLISIFDSVDIVNAQEVVDDFLLAYHGEQNTVEEFWEMYSALAGNQLISARAKLGLQIATITNYQPSITKRVLFDLGNEHISLLSTWTVAEWKQKISEVCEIAPAKLRVPAAIRGLETLATNSFIHEKYARRLAAVTQAMYPLANISAFLLGVDGHTIVADELARVEVVLFIANNPEFDIRETSIFELNTDNYNLVGIDLARLQNSLKSIARLAKIISGNPFAIIKLIQSGINSAKDIAEKSWTDFKQNYAYLFSPQENSILVGGPCSLQEIPGLVPTVDEVYKKSVSFTNALIAVVGGAMISSVDAYPAVLGNGTNINNVITTNELPIEGQGISYPHADTDEALASPHSRLPYSTPTYANVASGKYIDASTSTIPSYVPGVYGDPTLAALFGSLDYALCSDCKSVYSPAAYLTDTLNYLYTKAANVYASFDAKRSDIKYIQLNCDNTNTPVPYIDLVNEVLEVKVMGMDTSIPTPSTAFSFTTKTQKSISSLKSGDLSIVGQSGIGKSSISISDNSNSINIGNRNIAQNITTAPNNNVKVAVNQQQITNNSSPTSGDFIKKNGLLKGDKLAPGQIQAAYPERTYIDSTSLVAVDFYGAVSAGSTIPVFDRVYGTSGKLSTAVYPAVLPFNLAIEESRSYLQQFGKDRLEMMKLFRPVNQAIVASTGAVPTGSITDFGICAEFLGISQTAATIISGSHSNYISSIYSFYGATSASTGYPDPLNPGVSFVVSGGTSSDMWQDAMSGRVDILLQQSGITYNELLQYLTTDYLNPFISGSSTIRNISIKPRLISGTTYYANDTARLNELCIVFNTSGMASSNFSSGSGTISSDFYKKFHGFIRLVKTGLISIYHWDILLRSTLLTTTSATFFDNTTFTTVIQTLMIAKEFGVEPEILAMWWNKIDTHQYRNYPDNSSDTLNSVYEDIFCNKTIVNNSFTNAFKDPTALPTGTFASNSTTIATILGIKGSEILAITDYLSISSSAVSLTGLSRIYILCQLANASSCLIADFIDMLTLGGISVDAINNASAGTLSAFVGNLQLLGDTVNQIKASGFKIAEIEYLVSKTESLNSTAPPPSSIKDFLEKFRKTISQYSVYIAGYAGMSPTPTTIQINDNNALYLKLKNVLFQAFSIEFGISVEEVVTIIKSTFTTSATEGIIPDFFNGTFVKSTFNLSEENIQWIDGLSSTFLTTPISTSAVAGNNGNFKPNIAMTGFYRLYRYFHKVAFIYQRLGLRPKEFSYLFTLPTSVSITLGVPDSTLLANHLGFDFSKLPVYTDTSSILKTIVGNTITTSDAFTSFGSLLRVSKMIELVSLLSLNEDALGKILDIHAGVSRTSTGVTITGAPTHTFLVDSLNSLLNIIRGDIAGTRIDEVLGNEITGYGTITTLGASGPSSLLAPKFATLTAPSDFRPNSYRNIEMIISATKIVQESIKISLTPTEIKNLLLEGIVTKDTRNLIVALSSKYSADGWNSISKSLRDQIRLKQRDALVAYTRKSTNELFAELLIDVQMDACMETTRIKQAISSIQLFVDRVVLGLEKDATVTVSPPILTMDIGVLNQWHSWRKWYRIWEANRKIFFYPEDWMEPELRDDKTPFFKELEIELKQDALTMDSAEKAISTYLQKLDDVAKLQPMGTCVQETANGLIINHIISRTYNVPHKYYHRTVINNIWSPWEKMNIQISGDHVVPFVWNNRLCVYWLTFIDKSVPFTKKMRNTDFATYLSDTYTTLPATGDKLEWLYNDLTEIGNDQTGTNTDKVVNSYRHIQVSLNWCEYKDGDWKTMNVGKDTITLKLNPILDYIFNNTTNPLEVEVINKLMVNGHSALFDFVKSRLFLHPFIYRTGNTDYCRLTGVDVSYDLVDGDLYLMLMFPTFVGFGSGSHKEYADHIKAFHFSGTTNNMEVPRNLNLYRRILPLGNSYFKNQSLHSIDPGTPISNDTLSNTGAEYFFNYDRPVITSIYTAAAGTIPTGDRRDFTYNTLFRIVSGSDIIVPQKSNYRIVPTAGYSVSPNEAPFLFDDTDNIFYVSKTSYSTPDIFSLVSEAPRRDGGGLASGSFASDHSGTMVSPPTAGTAGRAIMFSGGTGSGTTTANYSFKTLYHHHVHVFMRMLNEYGVKGLMRPDLLNLTGSIPVVQAARDGSSGTANDDSIAFASQYSPTGLAIEIAGITKYPTNRVDFSVDGSYSAYNWELFFHIPMLIAQRLSENMQFFDAQKWYHYVFDPTSITYLNNSGSGAQRFWKFYPFYQKADPAISPETLETLLHNIRFNISNAQAQVAASSEHPFDPYMLGRLRPLAFMKMTLMKYLDNLIAWGDNLFMRDTIESINEATQIYMLASNLLGKDPAGNMQRATNKSKSFNDLHAIMTGTGLDGLDPIGEALVQIETFIDPNIGISTGAGSSTTFGKMGYFCLQPNNKLLTYWDKVEDRLFKIRHCQNIDGVVRKLSIYDAPIDPSILVRAAASGISIDSLLDDVNNSNGPHYRFSTMIQKANEFVNDVKALGNSLLSALEKKDAEQLASLRQGQELTMQNAILTLKQRQIDDAKVSLEALKKSQENTNAKIEHYKGLVANGLNQEEQDYLNNISNIGSKYFKIRDNSKIAQGLSIIPSVGVTIGMASGVSVTSGGSNLAAAASFFGATLASEQQEMQNNGAAISQKGQNKRRQEDWEFQLRTTKIELQGLEKQLEASQIKIDMAVNEYENQKTQIENAAKVNEYMQFKYTNQELYDWMTNQIATTYYQSFQLAYGMAKKALLCYRFELPDSALAQTDLIKAVYWDSRRKGLLAGELLQLDVRNMEASYMEENKRKFEITKHISLAQLDPHQLTILRNKGYCTFTIPEEWYDLDFPGHLNRTIKSVSLSIPCIAGPYTSIPCTLNLISSWRRIQPYTLSGTAPAYVRSNAAVSLPLSRCSSIASSSAQNDNGMFDFNFRDERYLPFEGAGAASAWTLSLYNSNSTTGSPIYPNIDMDAISDVILHVKYTASEPQTLFNTFVTAVKTMVAQYMAGSVSGFTPLGRIFSLKHEFPNEWFAFVSAFAADSSSNMEFSLKREHFPVNSKDRTIVIGNFYAVLSVKKEAMALRPTATYNLYMDRIVGSAVTSLCSIVPLPYNSTPSYSASSGSAGVYDVGADIIGIRLEGPDAMHTYPVPLNINDIFDDIYLVPIYKLS